METTREDITHGGKTTQENHGTSAPKKPPNELGDKQGKNSSKDMTAFCFSIQSEMGGLFLLFPRLLFFLFFSLPSLPPSLPASLTLG